MPNYITVALESAVSIFGIRSVYEQPSYQVLENLSEKIEIRRYAPRLAAEVDIEAEANRSARNEAFRVLAAYIFGKNRGKVDVGMTSPVETRSWLQTISMTTPVESHNNAGRLRMRFFLPGSITLETAPVPLDKRINIVPVPEEVSAVLTFRGRGTERVLAQRESELARVVAKSRWDPIADPATLFYDPPFTIPVLRRNEISVRVAAEDHTGVRSRVQVRSEDSASAEAQSGCL